MIWFLKLLQCCYRINSLSVTSADNVYPALTVQLTRGLLAKPVPLNPITVAVDVDARDVEYEHLGY